MSTQQPFKTASKPKMWIDYSSEEENQHGENGEVGGRKLSQNEKCHLLVETKQEKLNAKDNDKLLPLLSTSHQPVKKHLLQERKAMLDQLRQIKGNLVWVELYVDNPTDLQYLKQQIDQLRNSYMKEIVRVYPSRDNKNRYDVRVQYGLAERWIVEGVDKRNVIKIVLRKRAVERQQPQKNERRYDDYRRQEYYPVTTKQQPQTTPSTKYQPKYTQKKSNYISQINLEYVQKSAQTAEIQKKVEQSLREKKKDQSRREKGSKFYSKNPFQALNDSD